MRSGGQPDADGSVAAAALRVVDQVAAVAELDEFPAVALDALAAVIPYDVASYNEVDPRVPRIIEVSRPDGVVYPPELVARWVELRDEHPMYAYYVETGEGTARRISDHLSQDDYRATRLYQDVYRHLGVEYQMSCALPSAPPLVIAIALSRAHADFSDWERAVLERLRGYLSAVHEQARSRTLLREALERVATGGTYQCLALAHGGRLEAVGPRAAFVLERWFAEDSATRAELDVWVQRHRAGAVSAVDRRDGQDPMVLAGADAELTVRFVPGGSGPDVLLLGERPRLPAAALQALGLGARQAEVLLLAAEGFDNGQIAADLGITVATVRKHLEGVYAALGVNSRSAAVAAVYRLRSGLAETT